MNLKSHCHATDNDQIKVEDVYLSNTRTRVYYTTFSAIYTTIESYGD
ncbi:hypothetical protein [Companilactobacillus nodensis]|nr:hypothetical protein [Companilactobacillus nodensis]